MGWTSYRATHYKKGKIDRKAECDAYFLEGLNRGHFDVLKSSMVGSTYYAAIKPLKKGGSKDENGNYIYVDIPKEEQYVFAVVFLTSTDRKDYFNFSYKDMSEDMGPYQCDCPKGILDLLTPTENEMANEWRKMCYQNHEEKKKNKTNVNSLNKLPIGSVIKVTMPCRTRLYNEGDVVTLTKGYVYGVKRPAWVSPRARFTAGLMRLLEDHYEIIKKGV
jgi:hypothetical protein